MYFLTEDGLYEVLMQSRKPIAKQFKHEVKRILKDIRKHGIYAIDELLNNPDMAIKAFTALKEEQEKRKALEMEVEQTKPLVLFANSVQASQTSILIGELAKLLKQNGISIGEKRLFECLRDKGYLIKRKGSDWNMPTQKSMELGLFEVKETVVTHSDGHITVNKTTKVTGKGQIYFTDLFINKLAKTG
jgi:anti-repressor protein